MKGTLVFRRHIATLMHIGNLQGFFSCYAAPGELLKVKSVQEESWKVVFVTLVVISKKDAERFLARLVTISNHVIFVRKRRHKGMSRSKKLNQAQTERWLLNNWRTSTIDYTQRVIKEIAFISYPIIAIYVEMSWDRRQHRTQMIGILNEWNKKQQQVVSATQCHAVSKER